MKKETIALDERHGKLRLILLIAVLALALTAFTYAIVSFLHKDPGWREVEVKKSGQPTCAADFRFQYKLGAGAAAEYKKVQQIYSDAAEYAEAAFDLDAINQAPNQDVAVDPVLYRALSLMQEKGGRYLYLAPVYEYYTNIFQSHADWELESFDPRLSPEAAEACEEICAFINDPMEINLKLLGNDTVRLEVAEDYLAYAEETGIGAFLDFYWMRNAFLLDYIADTLIAEGFTHGYITSADGFSVSLGDPGEPFSTAIYDSLPEGVCEAAVMEYEGAMRIVGLHSSILEEKEGDRFYTLDDGQTRTPYIDPMDGLCKSAIADLVICSPEQSLAELVLAACPVYITEDWNPERAASLPGCVWCADRTVYHKGNMKITELFTSEKVQYKEETVQ